jgi:excisionase family DNA binding protein
MLFPDTPPFDLAACAATFGVKPEAMRFLFELTAWSLGARPAAAPSAEQSVGSLTVKQVCAILGVKRSKVYSLISSGDLPAFKIGGAVRIDAAELAEWKRKNRVAPVHSTDLDPLGATAPQPSPLPVPPRPGLRFLH